jgi:hypothetical protein
MRKVRTASFCGNVARRGHCPPEHNSDRTDLNNSKMRSACQVHIFRKLFEAGYENISVRNFCVGPVKRMFFGARFFSGMRVGPRSRTVVRIHWS